MAGVDGGLPSHQAVQQQEEVLLQRLPRPAQPLASLFSEPRTARYVDFAWETPTLHILRQFLARYETDRQLFFLNDLGIREQSSGASPDVPFSDTTNASSDSGSSGSQTSGTAATTYRASPDCVVLMIPERADNSNGTAAQRRIMTGEYKPCHALRSGIAQDIVKTPLLETYMLQLARETRERSTHRARKQQHEQDQQEQQDRAMSAEAGEGSTTAKKTKKKTALPRQVYYAYALTQTYHYMLLSGVAFGYVATGETLTVLHIPEEDATTLLYHTSIFPAPTSSTLPDLVTSTPPIAATDPADIDALLALPVSQLCSLTRVPSPLQTVSTNTHEAQEYQWNTLKASSCVRQPTLPYCTQACLLSLTQDGPMDPRCPNAALHGKGQNVRGHKMTSTQHPITVSQLNELVREQLLRTPDYDVQCLCNDGWRGAIGYVFKISATGYGYTFVGKAVQQQHRRQLRRESRVYERLQEQQGKLVPVCLGLIELAAPYPLFDIFLAVTHMLLLSYGGVSVWAAEEKWEQQEVGDEVALPWGDLDILAETQRTVQALEQAGLYDNDSNSANALWCAETRRVMKIDFDRAVVRTREDKSMRPEKTRKHEAYGKDEEAFGAQDRKKRTKHNGVEAIME
ncbi:hypothetical protein SCUCBS95973_000729 [Sporothrix curviconia]|uniref:Phosphotransferase family protein n=1 Tax=Sporothrix curviconia TaxID=1260050 RepID=A0ABP0ASN9_9PEZI